MVFQWGHPPLTKGWIFFEERGWSARDVAAKIQGCPGVTSDPDGTKRRWQRTCYDIAFAPPLEAIDRFLRRRMERWNVNLFPRIRVLRIRSILVRLAPLVPPRVRAAALRTALNGWCTSRRFQRAGRCFLGCGGQDIVEHYAACPEVLEFSRQKLGLQQSHIGAFILV